MIEMTREPIRLETLIEAVSSGEHGAVATFGGAVRRTGDKDGVVAMTYDGFEPLASKVLREIAVEAEHQWGAKIAAVHRLGRLNLGELSLGVAAGSPHRAEAFAACRYVVEELKKRLPVWKKEHYREGGEAWLDGKPLSESVK